jgi:hypothetical protein
VLVADCMQDRQSSEEKVEMSSRAGNQSIIGLNRAALAIAVCGAIVATTETTHAGLVDPGRGTAADMFMRVQLRDTSHVPLFDSGDVNLASSGIPVDTDWYFYFNPTTTYPGDFADPRYSASGSVQGRTVNGAMPALLGVSMTFTNTSASTLEFIIDYRMPLTADYNSQVAWTANLAGTLAGNDATLFTIENDHMFTGYVDSTTVGTKYPHPFGVFVGGGTAAFDDGGPISGFAADATEDLGIRLAFSLTPGDSATMNGSISMEKVAPAPGAAALLGFAGLVGTRRRRR